MQNVRFLIFTLFFLISSCQIPLSGDRGIRTRTPANQETCGGLFRLILKGKKTILNLEQAVKVTRPGQLGYGKPKVEYMKYRFGKWSLEKIQTYLNERPIPYVIRPDGKWVISDRHHLFLSLIKSRELLSERFPGKEINLVYELKADLSSATNEQYRKFMVGNKIINLRHKGIDIQWEDLPMDFNGLNRDFFRGMAYVLIKAEVVEKDMTPFAEFTWAEVLRSRFPASKVERVWDLENVEEVMEDVLKNPSAYSHLPGFKNSPPEIDEAIENIEKISSALGW